LVKAFDRIVDNFSAAWANGMRSICARSVFDQFPVINAAVRIVPSSHVAEPQTDHHADP